MQIIMITLGIVWILISLVGLAGFCLYVLRYWQVNFSRKQQAQNIQLPETMTDLHQIINEQSEEIDQYRDVFDRMTKRETNNGDSRTAWQMT